MGVDPFVVQGALDQLPEITFDASRCGCGISWAVPRDFSEVFSWGIYVVVNNMIMVVNS